MAAADVIRLLDVRDEPLSLDEVYASVVDPHAGGVGLFVGTVRDHDGGRGVDRLEYSAHPTVAARMREVAEAVTARFDVIALSAVHRVGSLGIGDIAVVVAVSAAHRGEAMGACHALIDDLKAGVPIWKHQVFGDGSDEWVGTP
ncbi:molybdenum cofactor biosynthesis protein MoaE [Solicola gregarius]|uniref:Molybdopterin synthase catalytic subunit 1 n=1 Tax=Solicola gregarius TaxID=2908642 RepID=A0AA46YL17_9ACTN|nr:molybdenum cofactor biosynthesis protein MoaE [Solicola gregarius]UYM06087.1 molybdenum cofactor biosynthesis protein MoaE [Solicola gregarius]